MTNATIKNINNSGQYEVAQKLTDQEK